MRASLLIVAGLVIIMSFGVAAGAAVLGVPYGGVDFITTDNGGNGNGENSIPDPTPSTFSCPDCHWFSWADSSWLQKIPPPGITIDEFYSATIVGRRYTSIVGQWYIWTVYHGAETHDCDPNDSITPLTDSNPSNPTHWGCPVRYGQQFQPSSPESVTPIDVDRDVVWSRPEWFETHTQGIVPFGVSGGLQSMLVSEVTRGLTGTFYNYRYSWGQCDMYRRTGQTTSIKVLVNGPGAHGGKEMTIDTTYCAKPPFDSPIPDGFAAYSADSQWGGGTEVAVNDMIDMWTNPPTTGGTNGHSFSYNMKASEDYFADGFHYTLDSIRASCQGWLLPYSASMGCYSAGSQQTHITINLIKSTVADGWNNPNPDTEMWFEGTVTTGATLVPVVGFPCGDVVIDEVDWQVTYVYQCQLSPYTDDQTAFLLRTTTAGQTGFPYVGLAAEPGSAHGSSSVIEDAEMVAGTWLPTSTTEQHYSDSDLAALKSYMSSLSWTDRIVLTRSWTYLSYQNVDSVKYGLTGRFTKFLGSGNPNDLWDVQYGMPPLFCQEAREHGWTSSYVIASCSTSDSGGNSGGATAWHFGCGPRGCSYSKEETNHAQETLAQRHARAFTQVAYAPNGCYNQATGEKGCWMNTEYYMWIDSSGRTVIMVGPQTTTIGVSCLLSGGTCPGGVPNQAGFVSVQGLQTITTVSNGKTVTVVTGTPYVVFTNVKASVSTYLNPYDGYWMVTTLPPYTTQLTTITGTRFFVVSSTMTSGGKTYVVSNTVPYFVSTDQAGAVHTQTTDSAGHTIEATPNLPEGQKKLGYKEPGGNQNLNNLSHCIEAGGKGVKECGFELIPSSLIPVASDTNILHDYRLFYDMSTGTFVSVDVGGTYGGPLMALMPDNPQTWASLGLPSVPHFGLTDQFPYVSVQVGPQTTMYAYWLWVPLVLVLCPIFIVVGLLLRRRDSNKKERVL